MSSSINSFDLLPNENLWPIIENLDLNSIHAFSSSESRIHEVSIEMMGVYANSIKNDAKDKQTTIYKWINEFKETDLSTPQALYKFFSTISSKAYSLVEGSSTTKILNAEDVAELDQKINQIERESLQIFWENLCPEIQNANPALPQLDTKLTAEQIRQWMSANQNLLNSVTSLRIMNPKMKILPPEIGKLISLRDLNLSISEIQQLPPEIGQLRSLERLGILCNQIKELPYELANLTSLRRICLPMKLIPHLPPEIVAIPNLRLN